MGMNYLINKLHEEISDLKTFNKSFLKLVDLTNRKKSVCDWEYPELFKWLKHDSMFQVSYKDETFIPYNWNEENEYCYSFGIKYNSNFYIISFASGQGTEFCFDKVKKFGKKYNWAEFTDFEKSVKSKLKFLNKKYKETVEKEKPLEQKRTELRKKLAAIETATTLLNLFELKLDDTSEKKVKQWSEELTKIL